VTGSQPGRPARSRLDRLRGRALPRNHDARAISPLAANPAAPAAPCWKRPAWTSRIAAAATVVSAACYPFTGCTSATEADDRRMRLNTRPFHKTDLDCALETAAQTGWAHLAGHRVCAA
jgi:hypothetical protein